MRSMLFALLAVGAAWLVLAGAARAQSAAQLYPYCSLSRSSGATSCYVSSPEQCDGTCIPNPSYVGPQRPAPYPHSRRALAPHARRAR